MAVLDSKELMRSCGEDSVGGGVASRRDSVVAGVEDVAGVWDERILLTTINRGMETDFKLRNWVPIYSIGPR